MTHANDKQDLNVGLSSFGTKSILHCTLITKVIWTLWSMCGEVEDEANAGTSAA
jgi:hypothetical protein